MRIPTRFIRALVFLILLFAATTGVTTLCSGWILGHNLTEQYEGNGRSIADSLAGSEVLLGRDASTIQATIDQFLEIKGVSYVFVADEKGEIIAHTFVPGIPDEVRQLEGQRDETISRRIKINGRLRCTDISSPILAGQGGFVHVGIDQGLIRQSIQSAIIMELLIMCLLFPLGGWAAYFLLRTDEGRRDTGVWQL